MPSLSAVAALPPTCSAVLVTTSHSGSLPVVSPVVAAAHEDGGRHPDSRDYLA